MASYHIWHPAYVNQHPETLEAFITLGDSIFLSRGTETFVQAALRALDLEIKPVSWQLEAIRTHYFGSYRGSTGEWEDDWPLAWRLRVMLSPGSQPALPQPPSWGYCNLDAADGSFRPDDRPRQWAGWHCLILADTVSSNVLDQAESIVRNSRGQAVCTRGIAFGRYPQLRCDLGYFPRGFYEQGAPEAEAVLREISQTGASVRFNGIKR
jgi:hypothetical protein